MAVNTVVFDHAVSEQRTDFMNNKQTSEHWTYIFEH